MKIVTKETEVGGRSLKLEVGRFAEQADAAVIAQYGETMVLATVVAGASREDLGYFPLSVEYVERLYAGGRIKGSRWVKREGRTSDEGVLIGRMVDRSIRPLFPKDYYHDVQVTSTVLSVDLENDPDALAVVAASAALAISSIPWNGPVGAVRVGLKDTFPFVNPREAEKPLSDLDLLVAVTKERVVMLDGGAQQVPENEVLKALNFAKEEAQKIIGIIEELQREVGLTKTTIGSKQADPKLTAEIGKAIQPQLVELITSTIQKENGSTALVGIKQSLVDSYGAERKNEIGTIVEELFKKTVRRLLLEEKQRPDGRKLDEVRPIEAAVGLLPRTHGSAMFKRGATQVLSVTTLGTPALQQLIESATGEESKKYIHHYSMPPYSTGETGRMGGPNRREIGHGALAERALEPVIPPEERFPYTVRVVSEVLSSNGSSSMASACGSTLSLMDAGVPITSPVSGVAMGLITGPDYGGQGDYVVLTDIAGIEDFNGDMDFKVTGTSRGLTAIQLDVKIPGLTEQMIQKTFEQSKQARALILEKMLQTIKEPRVKVSRHAPKVTVVHIEPGKIGEVIGPGGKMIRRLIEETACTIDVEDDGSVNISGLDEESVARAVAKIQALVQEAEVGQVYDGEVKRIESYGAFVEVLPGKEGLLHVSQMSPGFVDDPHKIVSLGRKIKVKVLKIDERGRVDLTALLNGEKKVEPPRGMGPRSPRPTGRGSFTSGANRPSAYPSRYVPQSRFRR